MAKKLNKSQGHSRLLVCEIQKKPTQNPSSRRLAENGVKVSSPLVYYIKSKTSQKRKAREGTRSRIIAELRCGESARNNYSCEGPHVKSVGSRTETTRGPAGQVRFAERSDQHKHSCRRRRK